MCLPEIVRKWIEEKLSISVLHMSENQKSTPAFFLAFFVTNLLNSNGKGLFLLQTLNLLCKILPIFPKVLR